jgi:hypothetical protein
MKNIRIGVVAFEYFEAYHDHDLIIEMLNWLIKYIEKGYEIAIVKRYFKGKYDELTSIKSIKHLNNFIKQYFPRR